MRCEIGSLLRAQAQCVIVKSMHLCASWMELMLDFYLNADVRWGAQGGGGVFNFRGTRKEANDTCWP